MSENVENIGRRRPFQMAGEAYLQAGWLPIPLRPGHKEPFEQGYTGKKNPYPGDKKSDYSDSRAFYDHWLSKAPTDANIGVWLDHTVIGIDVDDYVKGKDVKTGLAELAHMEAELKSELPETYVSSSRQDGKSGIRFFRIPRKFWKKSEWLAWQGKVSSSIEVIQMGHRFAVVAPSLHPDTRNPYRWYTPEQWRNGDESAPGDLNVPSLVDLPELPLAWVNRLTQKFMRWTDKEIDMTTPFPEVKAWYEERTDQSEMCRQMKSRLASAKKDIHDESQSHQFLTNGHYSLILAGTEGHRGSLEACKELEEHWTETVKAREKRDGLATVKREIYRSKTGAMRIAKGQLMEMEEAGADTKASKCGCVDLNAIEPDRPSEVSSQIVLAPLGSQQSPSEYELNDTGNAEALFDLTSRGNLVWVSGLEEFIVWNDERWRSDENNFTAISTFRMVAERQKNYADELSAIASANDDDDAKKRAGKLRAFAIGNGNVRPIENALKRYRTVHADASIKASKLDGNNYLVGMSNGVLDFTSSPPIFRQARKTDYVMLNTGLPYVLGGMEELRSMAEHNAELQLGLQYWFNYLDTFLPDEGLRHFTQKILGTVLTGVNEERIMIFLKGKSGTGKSTMLSAIMDALGEYAGVISYDAFNKKDDGNPAMVHALTKRLLTFSEMGDSVKIDAEVLKRIAGGSDPIKVRKLYSNDMIERVFGGTVVVGTNSSPEIKNYDKALDARLCVIPFDHAVMKDGDRKQMNTAMPQLLKRYARQVIFHWLYEGYLMYRREGISRNEWPELVELATTDFSDEVGDFGLFIREQIERCEYDEDDKDGTALRASAAYNRYKMWAEKRSGGEDGQFILGPRAFNKRLGSHDFDKKRIRFGDGGPEYAFVGCRLKDGGQVVNLKTV